MQANFPLFTASQVTNISSLLSGDPPFANARRSAAASSFCTAAWTGEGGESSCNKVAAAGDWAAYERAHRARLTAIFVPKLPRLPADAISHIVGLWAHTGYY